MDEEEEEESWMSCVSDGALAPVSQCLLRQSGRLQIARRHLHVCLLAPTRTDQRSDPQKLHNTVTDIEIQTYTKRKYNVE